MAIVLERHELPDDIRTIPAAVDADYFDVFSLATPHAADASPEEWARAGIEHAAGRAGQFVWRVLLGLRLDGRPSPDRIGGWKVADRGDTWVRVEASSRFMTAHMVLHVDDGRVTAATLIRYDRPPARLFWPRLAAAHRRAMPGLLHRAARRIARTK